MAGKKGKGKDGGRKSGQESSSLRTFYMVLGVVAVLGIGTVGYSVGSSAFSQAATAPVDLGELDDRALVDMAVPVERGDPDAPVTIIEFGDYQCPSCAQFATQYKPLVELNFVEPGTAKFVFYDLPIVSLHAHAFVAARAARCAGDQGRYWEFHDALFRNQSAWASRSSPVGAFLDYAEGLEMDAGALEACIESEEHADVVTANMELAQRLGVNGTPTILISEGDGMAQRLQSYSYDAIRRAVESTLEQ